MPTVLLPIGKIAGINTGKDMQNMEYISYQKQIPVAAEYDVIVCGGGAAGIGAALAAAEKGAKTALRVPTTTLASPLRIRFHWS